MMDYAGLYHDLASMLNRAFTEAHRLDVARDEARLRAFEDFIWEIESFLDDISLRPWSP